MFLHNAGRVEVLCSRRGCVLFSHWRPAELVRYQPWELGEGVNTLLRNSNFTIQGALMIDDADQATVDHILANNARFAQ